MTTFSSRPFAFLVTASLLCAGCAIKTEESYRDVPVLDRTLGASAASGDAEAEGASRIYLAALTEAGDRRLRSVQRDVVGDDLAVLESLFRGPNDDEVAKQLSSIIPSTAEVIDARSVGDILIVDVTSDITELTTDSLIFAVAQIVYTASEIDGIDAVRLRVDGAPFTWPLGNGEPSTGVLRTYDYPALIQSAQPAYPAVPSPG